MTDLKFFLYACIGITLWNEPGLACSDRKPSCQNEEETTKPWMHEDKSKFWICINGEATEASCPPGLYFLDTKLNQGCVPEMQWFCPDCGKPKVPDCDSESEIRKLWSHENRNKFWDCDEHFPIELSCPLGTGFVDNSEYLGCVPWNEWPCAGGFAEQPTCNNPDEDAVIFTQYRHEDPNKFWTCENGNASENECEGGTGFIEGGGCVPWNRCSVEYQPIP